MCSLEKKFSIVVIWADESGPHKGLLRVGENDDLYIDDTISQDFLPTNSVETYTCTSVNNNTPINEEFLFTKNSDNTISSYNNKVIGAKFWAFNGYEWSLDSNHIEKNLPVRIKPVCSDIASDVYSCNYFFDMGGYNPYIEKGIGESGISRYRMKMRKVSSNVGFSKNGAAFFVQYNKERVSGSVLVEKQENSPLTLIALLSIFLITLYKESK